MVEENPAGWWDDTYGEVDAVPWDTGDPQPAIVDLVEAGTVRGRVLDVGCGLGTESLFLADRGHSVVGVDFSEVGIERARERAADRSSDGDVSFRVADALDLAAAGLGTFGTAIDCGLLHALDPGERGEYTASLASVVSPGGRGLFVEFGTDAPADWGPNPLSESDLRGAFGDPWRIDAVESSAFETRERAVPGIVAVATRRE